ncbi:cupin domain-containing protein [Streptomyces sp. NPDC087856]|uniref:cupin domain-containing protein n=1 Tax=Streptomyces sp. NPDC087856 TaxID=3365811 RepID=UPI0037FE083A
MAARTLRSDDAQVQSLYDDLADAHLQPLWELPGLLTKEPEVAAVPHVWDYLTLQRLASRSGELIPIERGGDRRVLACSNPGLNGAPFVTPTLWAAVQFLNPGEGAPPHRHTPAALRFVLEGDAVWTTVDGDPLRMSRGDLVLTPSMTFHEHFNAGEKPMMWMDVLDLPMVAALGAVFFEEGPDDAVDTRTDPRSDSEMSYGGGPGLLPLLSEPVPRPRRSPLLAYRWADTDRALGYLADRDPAAPDVALRFADPTSGADVMPTMRCEMRRVRAGRKTARIRRTGSQVVAVLEGRGEVVLGESTFSLGRGDIFVIPSWVPCEVHADDELDMFSVSDAPLLESINLYRESRSD